MMTERIKKLRKMFVEDKIQIKSRQEAVDPFLLAKEFKQKNVKDFRRASERLIYVLDQEKPVIFENERIVFTRTQSSIPKLFTEEEYNNLNKKYHIHEHGDVCNINVNYAKLIFKGLKNTKKELTQTLESNSENAEYKEYLSSQIQILDSIQNLSNKYKELAKKEKNDLVYQTLSQVPENPPENFFQALQFFRIVHFVLWCEGNYHNVIGRFDQYMYSIFEKDLKNNVLNKTDALEMMEEFFLTFNRDSDLYPGMQQGDNGQSIVLGGLNVDGKDCFNLLSEICLEASLDLRLIDPKINLRVNKNTPLEIFEKGTQMTKQGLGFPQYSNDDVVIPGLIELGYEVKDAYNYSIAACWEFIIPNRAMDIPNIDALSFATSMEDAVFSDLEKCNSYSEFQKVVDKNIVKQANQIIENSKNVYLFPAPFVTLMMETKKNDISKGSYYNNYGIHGNGIATAVDSLANIKKFVFEEKSISASEMIKVLKANFKGYERLYHRLRYEGPKMGNDIDYVDNIATHLIDVFSMALKNKKNDRGGIFRAGTGSAMYYLWQAKGFPASPDGRRSDEGFGANYSPSLFSQVRGPISVIKSFTKPDLKKVINGGPLTLEFHDTVFKNQESITKVAQFVKSFICMGGHQLQLNSVNRETLLKAQKEPDKYRNLIVRVWGWSGYFVELDKCYQEHIIKRTEF